MAPSLFPIVTRPVSEPPFECSGHGLLFNNCPRTPLGDLRAWLFPKHRSTKPLSRPKAWWQAQLVLYGLGMPKKSETIAALRARLEVAVQSGKCDELPAELREREDRMNKRFVEANCAERFRRYAGGSEEEATAASDPEVFLRNKFLSGGGTEEMRQVNVCVLKALESGDRAGVHLAAERLGLFSHSADAPRDERWLVIGKERDAIWAELRRINGLKAVEDEEKTAAKRRKVEQAHKACIGGKGDAGASDIVGQYDIQCDNIDQQWPEGDALSLSIFREAGRLRGSFNLRIVEGVMKFKAGAGGASTGKAGKNTKYEFKWRGSETGTGEIYPDDKEQQGYILVQSGGKIKGKFKSVSAAGDCEFSALKVSNTPSNRDAEWDDYDDDAYERARVGRWG